MNDTCDGGDRSTADSTRPCAITNEQIFSYHQQAGKVIAQTAREAIGSAATLALPTVDLVDPGRQAPGERPVAQVAGTAAVGAGTEALPAGTAAGGTDRPNDRPAPRIINGVAQGVAGIDPEKATRAVSALNQIADDSDLLRRLSKDATTISRRDLQEALLLDSRVKDKKGPAPNGPEYYLDDKERAAVKYLHDNWATLVGNESKAVRVGEFGSSALARNTGGDVKNTIAALAGAAAAAGGASIRDQIEKLDPQIKDQLEGLGKLIGDQIVQKSEEKKELDPSKRTDKLSTKDIREIGERVFDRIDTDGNGFLSEEELGRAVMDKQFTGQEAQVVAALHKSRSRIQELSNDEWFYENDGITKKDLAKFDAMDADRTTRTEAIYDAEDWAKSDSFKKYDTDGNGRISEEELKDGLANKDQLSEQDLRILTHLRDRYHEIKKASNDQWFRETEISAKDIEKYSRRWLSEGDEAKLVGDTDYHIYRTHEGQRAGNSNDLFANKDNPAASVTPDAIKQGTIGNCYFLSALATMAKQNPEAIVKMIKDNGDGTYTVTFPGDPKHPITVKAPTEAERGLYNAGSPHGTWASVMEKAYGKYLQERKNAGGATDAEGADGGGWAEHPLELMTGKEYTEKKLKDMSDEELVRELSDAFKNDDAEPMEAGIDGDKAKGKDGTTPDGFATTHSYSVVGFRPDGKGGGTVVIRNPWGGDKGTGGTIEISLETFRKNFSSITYHKD